MAGRDSRLNCDDMHIGADDGVANGERLGGSQPPGWSLVSVHILEPLNTNTLSHTGME